jgi:hypothetical protein
LNAPSESGGAFVLQDPSVTLNRIVPPIVARAAALGLIVLAAMSCEKAAPARESASPTRVDSMGPPPTDVRTATVIGHPDLTETSAAALSTAHPDVWFTINDSGHEPVLFAVDTTGAARGRWVVGAARNSDWESLAYGSCGTSSRGRCLYIGDTGDNDARRPTRTIYRVAEPIAGVRQASERGSVSTSARLTYRYAEGPLDVEAMYLAPDASIFLIAKGSSGRGQPLRPASVFRLAPEAWSGRGTQEAVLVDSLPIVPGSAFARFVTDAALSPDGKHLAVRTYMQVYVFATDSATGRVRNTVPPALCNLSSVGEEQGEGITWTADSRRLLLTSEGRAAQFRMVSCPLPPVS